MKLRKTKRIISINGVIPVRLSSNLKKINIERSNFNSGTDSTIVGTVRITESGIRRVTESGAFRILE